MIRITRFFTMRRNFKMTVLLGTGLLVLSLISLVIGQGGHPRQPRPGSTAKITSPKTTSPSTGQGAAGKKRPADLTTRLGIEFVLVPAGSFMMGSTPIEFERPVHKVTMNSFYMSQYEVTQAQWQAVMGSDRSKNKTCGGKCPADTISWNDAQEFIGKLNQMNDGYTYRLPTEAEWEYACRAGNSGAARNLNLYGWNSVTSDHQTHPVGTKPPNAFGLYDMHGNVWEWVEDYWHSTYTNAPVDGSAWVTGGSLQYRVIRGGGHEEIGINCSWRIFLSPGSDGHADGDHGLRLVAIARRQ